MALWPVKGPVVPLLLSTHSRQFLGTVLAGMGTAAPISFGLLGGANECLFFPFRLCEPIVAVKLWLYNGATAAGSVDMGVYTPDGARIVSIGSTVQAGTSAIQEFNITDTLLPAGRYYLGIGSTSTVSTVFGVWNSGTTGQQANKLLGGLFQATYPLPASATFAVIGASYGIPLMGLSKRTLVA